MDAFSGGTSQPCLGSIVEALRHTERDTGLDIAAIRAHQQLLGGRARAVRRLRGRAQAPASEVYLHEMPGGQFTNLKAQARSLGLEERWHEVAQAYADANMMFGDIVKVTPSSKVVGDMALMMVAQGLTRAQVEDPAVEVAFPDSVVDMLQGQPRPAPGRLARGAPAQGPEGRGAARPTARRATCRPWTSRRLRAKAQKPSSEGEPLDDEDLNGYLMYPKVFARLRGPPQDLWPGPDPAHAGLLLRHGARRGDQRRDRPRQDAGDPPPGRGRDHRRGRRPRLLRAERPAAHDPRPEPHGRRPRRRGGPRPRPATRPCRRADAGRGGDASRRRPASRCRRATCSSPSRR